MGVHTDGMTAPVRIDPRDPQMPGRLQTHAVTGGQGAFSPEFDEGMLLHVGKNPGIGFLQERLRFQ